MKSKAKLRTISECAKGGLFADGDWIESKDQDEHGSIRLIQLADIGDGIFMDISNRRVNKATAERLRCTFLKRDDVLVARMPDPLGRSCVFPYDGLNEYITVVDVCIIRTNHLEVLPAYLSHLLNSPTLRQFMWDNRSGTTRARITRKKLGDFKIPVPDPTEQLRIVRKLERLFEKIDHAIKLVEENLEIAGKLMGSVLEETFNVNSNERFIWVELETLTELITKGSSPKWQGVDYVEKSKNAVLFITSENVGNHRMLLNNKKYVDATFNKIEPRSILKDGDILMNIVGASIGRTAVYNLTEVANINQAVCLIRLDNSKIDNEYALHFFNSPLCNSYMMDKQVDNARANLSMGSIKKFRIPILTLGDQKKLVMYLNKAHAKQIELANHFTTRLTQLRELKSSILESAFKGEL